jgi:signal transduction histidine kinase
MGRVCVLRDITSFKQVDALKSEFVATVSHDLRSPLTLLRGYATMLDMVGELNEQQSNYVLKIISGVEGMSSLVNNLLDLGRIESGVDLQLEIVSAPEIADRVVNSLQAQATQKQVKLTFIYDEEIPNMQADPALVQHALNNLVENAIKFSESGGEVSVQVVLHKDYIIYEVSDQGIGIAPVDQPRLFEKFFRGAQQTDVKQVGSGLGLAMVRSVAERHNGRVWFKSQLGQGSTFYLAIPIRQPLKPTVQ